jgi:hypothetical protein
MGLQKLKESHYMFFFQLSDKAVPMFLWALDA